MAVRLLATSTLELIEPDTVTLNLEEVDFGGKKVWPNGPGSVRVEAQRITLSPTNMQETLSITLTINDTLANYYFGHVGRVLLGNKQPWSRRKRQ